MGHASRTLELVQQGVSAEFSRKLDDARALYQAAWEAVVDDHDACVAAHYVAHLTDDPQQALHWNTLALQHAQRVTDGSVQDFYGSLYVNLGRSHELLGNAGQARHWYALAAARGVTHQPLTGE